MKKGYALALIGALMSGLSLVQPAVSSAAVACAGPMGPGQIKGSLTVTGDCVLAPGTTVTGSVKMATGSLTMDGVTVKGSLQQSGGTLLVENSTIKGSVTVTGTEDGSQNDICGSSVVGSVNVRGVTGDPAGWFRLLGTDAFAPVTACTAPFGAMSVTGSVNYIDNDIYVRVAEAAVGGSVKLTSNASGAYGNAGDVSFNTIRGSLNCQDNNPDPSGGGNTVGGSRKGECATF